MRRSICYCEPSIALAGKRSNWKFFYSPSTSLPKGTRLKFDPNSQGRDIDWEAPFAGEEQEENVIYALTESGKVLHAKELDSDEGVVPAFEFVLKEEMKEGEQLQIVMGAPLGQEDQAEELGNTSQTNTQRRRQFHLYVDPKGKGLYDDPEVFLMDIRGNELSHIRIITPSYVQRNKRFDVTVRFEDDFGNLTSNAPEGTLVELSHEYLRENLNWKLFVPETGFITLPNIYFNEEGVYTIRLKNLQSGEFFCSSPIRCSNEMTDNLYWGLLHGESERVDSTENIESCMRYFRDENALNFFATSASDDPLETTNDIWKSIVQNVTEFNEPDRFVGMLGFQWQGDEPSEGVRQFLYAKDNKPILRSKDTKFNSLKKIYKTISPGEVLSIPCFSMGKKYGCNFEHFYPEFERVVEIYNAWGSSECLEKDGNPAPISAAGKKGVKESAEGSIRAALLRNCRFGFVAGGLDDRGVYSDFYNSEQTQYHPGLTAILSEEHSREALIKALYHRRCYATTGQRIILGFDIAGFSMGSEINLQDKPGLTLNRHISGHVAGTDTIEKIDIIRNGQVIHSIKADDYHTDYSFDDLEPLEKVVHNPGDKRLPFVYYYVRVTQKDQHMAWSSPIWIDFDKTPKSPKPSKKKS